jgi:serine/threonine protein kinase/tetratricopeptide (TPR) repeat protein
MTPSVSPTPVPETLGRYRVERALGEGGMGIVYAAVDSRLGRRVAIKRVRDHTADPSARERLWREARLAARVSHPNLCSLFEVDDESGELLLVMELLEGEPLSARIPRGALPLGEAVHITLEILSALAALHHAGIVHRDLKPSNIYLTPHGVKLLDFGLARSAPSDLTVTVDDLTLPGIVVGTPRYMAPEQWRGETPGPAADLYATGAVLYEMVTGQPAFTGRSAIEIYDAVVRQDPPALAGTPAVLALDRVLHRALAKRSQDRYESADHMAQGLRESLLLVDSHETPRVRATTRLVVLPFKMLRADPEIEYLSFGLADAITTSLSAADELIVRSSLVGARFQDGAPDLQRLAVEANVDAVLTGTLLRLGDQVRVGSQLIEVPSGTVLWSETAEVAANEAFRLQDSLARGVRAQLVPSTERDPSPRPNEAPASSRAYELYLRANLAALEYRSTPEARDLYLACLREDPGFAPAWARLGRAYWILAKYRLGAGTDTLALAEQAFRRALELKPDSPIANSLYSRLEVHTGRVRDALTRLVPLALAHSSDPDLYAGLCHACRYAGLLEASVAADRQARRYDPTVRTSVAWTFWLMGDYGRAISADIDEVKTVTCMSLAALGRGAEAVAITRDLMERANFPKAEGEYLEVMLAVIEGDGSRVQDLVRIIGDLGEPDAEGVYMLARFLCMHGDPDQGLAYLDQAIRGGYWCYPAFVRDPWLDPVRDRPEFARILKRAEALNREAAQVFTDAGGDRLLGMARR